MPGNIKSINGSSMGLNGAPPGDALTKPSASGSSHNPGGTKPNKPAEAPVKMPK
jgi:hypothetical protein